MNNSEVARVLQDIADMLEMKGESPFKVRAYQRAARSLENMSAGVDQLLQQGSLREVAGIGAALEKKISELVTTGRLQYYENLKSEFPEGIGAILNIPGVGPKTAMRLVQELGIKSADELETAIVQGRVAELSRMGDKTASNILRNIQSMRTKEQRMPLGVVLPVVDRIIAELRQHPGVHNLSAAGSVRRFKETVGDIDLMGTADDPEAILKAFVALPEMRQVIGVGTTKASVVADPGLQVDFRVVEHDSYGSLLQYFTGSKQHNILLRDKEHRRGLKLSEFGITDLSTGVLEKFSTEEEFYSRLGLQFIPPELREGGAEIEKAEQGALPRLVELADIKGDLHVHTNWSDGRSSIEDLVSAARALGYEYLAITDHSAGRGIAHGLSEERLREQIQEIRRINESSAGPWLLAGIEVDIRADGRLDLPDELLEELDIVIAAVHSSMGQDERKMTQRILKALENPNVDVLAHPSCRLLGEREAVAVDWEAIFQAALRTDTALEINAMPVRLDLRDIHVLRAKEVGVKLAIDTDSHSPGQLKYMGFGVSVARRGWCEAEHILNTRPLEEVRGFLKRRGSGLDRK